MRNREFAEGVRVLLVDDHQAVRQGLHAMLEVEPGLEPAASAAGSREALALAADVGPDVVLLDYHLPDEDGLSLCLRLKASEAPPRVLIYSAFADDMLGLLAAVAGADGLVSKGALAEELCHALRAVARGESLLGPPSPATMERAASALDPEDLPIIGMLIYGTPPPEIAETLGVADAWLTARRWAILERLTGGASRRSGPRRATAAAVAGTSL
ncbi:MAG: response regulator transcription factor [Actinomycetota bacterium]|nr:response regulator transcription factor [Actinomycetota bacterium]